MLCKNIESVNGNLHFAGMNTLTLAKKYGTPLYLMDEERIRENCRIYKNALGKLYDNFTVLYASKACSFKRIYEIMKEENMGIDVVSSGEIYTALRAGFPLEKAYFHSNNKTDDDISFAMENSLGHFVVDGFDELDAIERIASKLGKNQKILLRLTPGIDTHTYEAVNTGKVDSKFGTAIETGQAEEIVEYALKFKHIQLCGFHCHIGSNVFDSDTFLRGSEIMLDFMGLMREKFDYTAKELDLGGGYGVRYTDDDEYIDIAENIKKVYEAVKLKIDAMNYPMPQILMEPGRSIVADAGMTLYTAGTVKEITGYKNYLSVDGGMTDNPRYALYKSPYTVFLANKMDKESNYKCSLVGRCCESGDVIQEDITIPKPHRGDIVAVATTGAYNYSMASNYNRIPRPPVVMINSGEDYIAVRRETLEDLTVNDL
ncbi:MAG: diaminopimelate decarboxylase [Clostridia bacterium]|nr:diaminopimelate decarboxylase [Clostridia bacterium]